MKSGPFTLIQSVQSVQYIATKSVGWIKIIAATCESPDLNNRRNHAWKMPFSSCFINSDKYFSSIPSGKYGFQMETRIWKKSGTRKRSTILTNIYIAIKATEEELPINQYSKTVATWLIKWFFYKTFFLIEVLSKTIQTTWISQH